MSTEEIIKFSKIFSSKTRLRLIQLLSKDELTSKEIWEKFKGEYKDIRRESIFRELEKLRKSNIIKRKYDEKKKQFVYSLNLKEIKIERKEICLL